MERDYVKEILPVIQAFAKGREVEYNVHSSTGWQTTDNPNFSQDMNWRIKPGPLWGIYNHKTECLWQKTFNSKKEAKNACCFNSNDNYYKKNYSIFKIV